MIPEYTHSVWNLSTYYFMTLAAGDLSNGKMNEMSVLINKNQQHFHNTHKSKER